jgi:hypothetical protein
MQHLLDQIWFGLSGCPVSIQGSGLGPVTAEAVRISKLLSENGHEPLPSFQSSGSGAGPEASADFVLAAIIACQFRIAFHNRR